MFVTLVLVASCCLLDNQRQCKQISADSMSRLFSESDEELRHVWLCNDKYVEHIAIAQSRRVSRATTFVNLPVAATKVICTVKIFPLSLAQRV